MDDVSRGIGMVPQYVFQDAAVAEVFELVERVDAAEERDRFDAIIGAMDLALDRPLVA